MLLLVVPRITFVQLVPSLLRNELTGFLYGLEPGGQPTLCP